MSTGPSYDVELLGNLELSHYYQLLYSPNKMNLIWEYILKDLPQKFKNQIVVQEACNWDMQSLLRALYQSIQFSYTWNLPRTVN